MFDQLLESSTIQKKSRNPWAYGISLVVQTLMIGVMILIPLLYTEALPKQEMLSWLVAPPPPPPPPPPPAAEVVKRVVRKVSLMDAGKLRAPREIPREIAMIKEDPIQDDFGVVGGVPGGIPGGQLGGVIGGVLGGIPSVAPPPQITPQRIRVSSGVQEAKILQKIEPVFPPIAKQARIQGTVRLEAIIAKDGSIQNLRVIEGHPLLVQAALQAVQQWRYQPTLLNNEPVEVVTFIDVIFRLY
ncbi:MAG: energy transducer TonB [Acidobacteria bacterium]|nr:energy transducer TonB [Acidobacteriota bacterium]